MKPQVNEIILLTIHVGEWLARTIRHLDKQAFDSREMGRACLTLNGESCSLSGFDSELTRLRNAAVDACSFGIFGPEVIDRVRFAIAHEIGNFQEKS